MKKSLFALLAISTFLFLFPVNQATAVTSSRMINFQAVIKDNFGNPWSGPTVDLIFELYDSSDSLIWTEYQPGVAIDSTGVVNTYLGVVSPLDPTAFDDYFADQPLKLRLTIDGIEIEEDFLVASHGHSFTAKRADLLDGLDSTDLALSTDLDSHAGDASAHHARYTDSEAVAAVTPQIGSSIAIHAAIPDAHHTRYTDAEAVTASSPEITAAVALHEAIPEVHHAKTTSFTELTDTASDAQIPDNITINYAAQAGDSDTVDGLHANEIQDADDHVTKADEAYTVDGYHAEELTDLTLGQLSLVDIAVANDGWANLFASLMVAAMPSSDRVYVRAFKKKNYTYFDDPSSWDPWTDFGAPDPGSKITGISVSLSHDGAANLFSGMITARLSSGKVFLKAFKKKNHTYLDDPVNWDPWTDFSSP